MSKRNGNGNGSNGNSYRDRHSEYTPVRNCPRCRGALYYSYDLKKKPVIKCFQCGAYYEGLANYRKRSPEEVMSVKMISPIQDKSSKVKSGKRLDFKGEIESDLHKLIFSSR